MEIGDTITTKFGNELVIGRISKEGKRKYYHVSCDVCSKDVEMHPSLFKMRSDSKGTPCWCGENHSTSERQWKLLCKRELENSDFSLIDFGEYKKGSTLVYVQCNKHLNKLMIQAFKVVQGILPECYLCQQEKQAKALFSIYSETNPLINVIKSDYKKGDQDISLLVECSKCSEDIELFPQKYFNLSFKALKTKNTPCACSGVFSFSKEQLVLRVLRACVDKNCSFLGFVGGFNGMQTKLKLSCLVHKTVTWDTTTISSFVNSSRKGCWLCVREEDSAAIEEFMATGNFHKDTKFTRTGKSGSYWNVWCPVCAKDAYSSAGLCDGNFKCRGNLLKEGTISCRCSFRPRLTIPMWDLRITNLLEEGESYKWISKDKIMIKCPIPEHLPYIQKASNFCTRGHRCRACADFGLDTSSPTWLYLVTWIFENLKFDKVGVTSRQDLMTRLKEQSGVTSAKILSILAVKLETGAIAEDLEFHLKDKFGSGFMDAKYFPDGYTETLPHGVLKWDYILEEINRRGHELLELYSS